MHNSAIKFTTALENLLVRACERIDCSREVCPLICIPFPRRRCRQWKSHNGAGRLNSLTSGGMSHSRLRNNRVPPTNPLKGEDMRSLS